MLEVISVENIFNEWLCFRFFLLRKHVDLKNPCCYRLKTWIIGLVYFVLNNLHTIQQQQCSLNQNHFISKCFCCLCDKDRQSVLPGRQSVSPLCLSKVTVLLWTQCWMYMCINDHAKEKIMCFPHVQDTLSKMCSQPFSLQVQPLSETR